MQMELFKTVEKASGREEAGGDNSVALIGSRSRIEGAILLGIAYAGSLLPDPSLIMLLEFRACRNNSDTIRGAPLRLLSTRFRPPSTPLDKIE